MIKYLSIIVSVVAITLISVALSVGLLSSNYLPEQVNQIRKERPKLVDDIFIEKLRPVVHKCFSSRYLPAMVISRVPRVNIVSALSHKIISSSDVEMLIRHNIIEFQAKIKVTS